MTPVSAGQEGGGLIVVYWRLSRMKVVMWGAGLIWWVMDLLLWLVVGYCGGLLLWVIVVGPWWVIVVRYLSVRWFVGIYFCSLMRLV